MSPDQKRIGKYLRRVRATRMTHRDAMATVVGACHFRYEFGDVNPWSILLPMLSDGHIVDPIEFDRQIVAAEFARKPVDDITGEPIA